MAAKTAMILCAGLGTRLRPLTEWRSKPLLAVGDRPLLAHIVEKLSAAGFDRIVANAFYRPDDLRRFAAASGIELVEERELLGTAGGVANARAALGSGEVLVWNGDICTAADPRALRNGGGAMATLLVRPAATGRGNVGIDAGGRVVRVRQETTRPGEVRAASYVGVCVLGGELRARLPARGCLIADVLLPELRHGSEVCVVETTEAWLDIGTVETYLAANLAWLTSRAKRCWVAPDARVDDAVALDRSLVGAGARVSGRGSLRRCVVWPGAQATAPLEDCVVAPEGIARR